MKFYLKKHVKTGVGQSLFLQKEIEPIIQPCIGMQIAWGTNVEKIQEIIVDLNTDLISLWVESDEELQGTTLGKDACLNALNEKMRDYMNTKGWVIQ